MWFEESFYQKKMSETILPLRVGYFPMWYENDNLYKDIVNVTVL